VTLHDYKTVLYRRDDGSWVEEVPSLSGCCALMPTYAEAVAELSEVFKMVAQEYGEKGMPLPVDTAEIVHAWRHSACCQPDSTLSDLILGHLFSFLV